MLLATAGILFGGCSHDTPRLRQLNATLKASPTNSWEIANRGHVYAILGDRYHAYADLTRASRIGGSGDLHSRIGWSYFNLGDITAAIREWQTAAALNKFAHDYDYYALAIGYWAAGNYQRAMEYYDRLVKAYPSFSALSSLEYRITHWTVKEKTAVRSVFVLWQRAYIESKH